MRESPVAVAMGDTDLRKKFHHRCERRAWFLPPTLRNAVRDATAASR